MTDNNFGKGWDPSEVRAQGDPFGASEVPETGDMAATTPQGVSIVDVDDDADERDFVPPPGRLAGTVVLGMSQSIDNSEGGVSRTFFPQIMNAFGLGDDSLGLLGGLSSGARMIFGPLWAIQADRFGRKRILFVVTGLWGLWTVAAGYAPNWPVLLIIYSISLIGTVASEPILNGLLGSLYSRSERGKAFGTVRGVSAAVGFIITPLLGQFGSNPEGWRWAFMTMGGLSILSGILILIFVKEPDRDTTGGSEEVKAEAGMFRWSDAAKVMKIPTLALMAPMLLLVTSLVLFNFVAQVWARDFGFGITNAAYLNTVMQIGMAVSALVGGLTGDWFVRRLGHKGRIVLFQIYGVAFAAIIALTMYWARLWDSDIVRGDGQVVTNDPSLLYYVMVFLMGLIFSFGFSGCVLPMVSTVCPRQLSATSFALLFSLIQGGINTVYQPLVGVIARAIGDLPLTILVGVCVPYVLNSLYWSLFYRTYEKDVSLQNERTRLIAEGKF
ncbi:MAG: MFS transporter [Propionibacteriaceae bacterium]|nr:MFS transporter [Propionibacteriaceae bacterium]